MQHLSQKWRLHWHHAQQPAQLMAVVVG